MTAVAVTRKPRIAKKRGYHHGDLAQALKQAALRLIDERGLEAFTLREAARAVGVTHPAAYRHFEDKRALLAAIAEEGFVALTGEMTAATDTIRGDVFERVSAIGRSYVRFALERPAEFRVMFGPRLNADGRFTALAEVVAAAFQVLISEIETGQARKVLRDGKPRDLASALWISAHGYASLVLYDKITVRSPARAETYFLELLQPLYDGLRRKR